MEILDARAGDVTELSPLFHYYVARPNPASLAQLSLREGFAAAGSSGICRRTLHDQPIDPGGAGVRPSPQARADARRRRIAFDVTTRQWEYRRVPDANRTQHAREAIRRGMPVAFGFWLTPAYGAIEQTANVHPPAARDGSNTAHAVVGIGFDNGRSQFLVKDSQGAAFAADGHWWLPFALVETDVVFEAWTVDRLTYDD
jgi:hypothetical protein